jgi:SAM-dependent methyltransferase
VPPATRSTAESDTHCPLCGSADVSNIYAREFKGRTWQLAACGGCSLKFTNPTPTQADINSFYSGNYHSILRTPGAAEAEHGKRFSDFADFVEMHCPPPGRTLDIGCSTGLFPATLKRRGYNAEGFEFSKESAEWGSAHYGLPIHTEPVERDTYPASAYDLVSMTDVLEHTLHPVQYLAHVKRILKPGGYALVTFPDIDAPQMRYSLTMSRLLQRPELYISQIPYHTWEFNRRTATATFNQAGFDVHAFRRRQPLMRRWPVKAIPFEMPCWLLSVPPLPTWLGLRMQFIIRSR